MRRPKPGGHQPSPHGPKHGAPKVPRRRHARPDADPLARACASQRPIFGAVSIEITHPSAHATLQSTLSAHPHLAAASASCMLIARQLPEQWLSACSRARGPLGRRVVAFSVPLNRAVSACISIETKGAGVPLMLPLTAHGALHQPSGRRATPLTIVATSCRNKHSQAACSAGW